MRLIKAYTLTALALISITLLEYLNQPLWVFPALVFASYLAVEVKA